jgi:hypothetical protein
VAFCLIGFSVLFIVLIVSCSCSRTTACQLNDPCLLTWNTAAGNPLSCGDLAVPYRQPKSVIHQPARLTSRQLRPESTAYWILVLMGSVLVGLADQHPSMMLSYPLIIEQNLNL